MTARSPSSFAVSRFRDALDVIPVRVDLSLAELKRLFAPASPPVRVDIREESRRQIDLLEAALRGLLSGRAPERLQRQHVYRDLEKVAFKARGEGSCETAVLDAVNARAEALRDAVRRRTKGLLPCASPTAYLPGATRRADGVEHVSCLILDIDDGSPICEAIEVWKPAPLLLYSTWSHTTDHPRYRIVLPLAVPVPASSWLGAWEWARRHAGGHMDEACKDPSRLYILPAIQDRRAPYQAFVRDDGSPFLEIPAEAVEAPSRTPSSPPTPRGNVRVPEADALRVARARLRTDREARVKAAAWLGAKVTGRRAERIRCPSCGEPSVWFWIEPGSQSTAVCSHKNSCGWWGHLDELLQAAGVSHG